MESWYLNDNYKDTMIYQWETRLNITTLDRDTLCTEYINKFDMYVRKLSNIGETWTYDKMLQYFKHIVDDLGYDT